MICPPKANAPIVHRYSDESLDRRHRIALIPPTEELAIMLNKLDKSFVHREFPDKIRDIKNTNDFYNFWLKVIHVEHMPQVPTTTGMNPITGASGVKQSRTDIYVMDMSSEGSTAILALYDNQTTLGSIFRRNDYIGLTHPFIQSTRVGGQEIVFEYSNDSVVFLMPEKEAQEAGLAKVNLTSMIEEDDNSTSDLTKKDIAERDEEVSFSFI